MYHAGGEDAFKAQIKRIEEAAVDSIYTDLRLRGTDEGTEVLVKERASNFVTTLLTSFTYERAEQQRKNGDVSSNRRSRLRSRAMESPFQFVPDPGRTD